MFKNLSKTTKVFAGLIVAVVVIMIIVISISGNKSPVASTAHYVKDNAAADNKVEALKTVSADLQAVNKKNGALEKSVAQLKLQNQQTLATLKQSVSTSMKSALQQLQQQNHQSEQRLAERIKAKRAQSASYAINGEGSKGQFVWVSDMSVKKSAASDTTTTQNTSTTSGVTDSLLHLGEKSHKNKAKSPVKPVYTIPMNATLTGAHLMTPLVGRIPIDGKLPSPYHFKLVLSNKNLTANGVPLPGVNGAVASGIVSGDLLGSCARGELHSITFIFNDGTISTTKSSGDTDSLGYISTQSGNPCIPGTLHSDAALFLGAQVGFGAVQGYANSISDSQYMRGANSEGQTFRTLIGDANKAAAGQALSSGAQAAQTWWDRRVQNSFDYVYVPNTDKDRTMKVVVNITQQIPIDYNPNARKVSYEQTLQTLNTHLD